MDIKLSIYTSEGIVEKTVKDGYLPSMITYMCDFLSQKNVEKVLVEKVKSSYESSDKDSEAR